MEQLKNEIKPYMGNFLINMNDTDFICTFNKLSKGVNIKRFADRYEYELFISAGDNVEDDSMFKITPISIGKKNAIYNFNIVNKLDYCSAVINKVYEIVCL